MTLYARITGDPDPLRKISPHAMMAVLAEWQRGQITGAQAVNAFNPPLDATEQTEGTALRDALVAGTIIRTELHDVLLMAEEGMDPYNVEANVKTRLGF